MKDYNEMAKAVFERRDEYVAARKKQRATLLKAGVTLCSVVLVCLVGLTLWLGGLRGPAKAPAPPVQPPTKNTEVTVIPENTDETQNVQQIVTEPVRIPADVDPTEPSKNTSGDSVSDGHPDVVPPNIDATSAEDPTEPQAPTVVPDDTEPEDVVKPTLPMEGTEPVATEPCIPPTRPLLPDSPPKPTVATEPTVDVNPTDTTEDLTEPSYTGELTITVGGKQYVAQVGDMVTYTAELYVKDYFEAFQAGILYDSQLEVIEVVNGEEDPAPVHFPNLKDGSERLNYQRNKGNGAEKQIFVSARRLSGYKFREQKVLFTFDFMVKKPGETKIVLDIEELVAKGGEPSYFTGGKQIVSEGINIEEYLSVTPADEVVIPTAPKDEEIVETIPPFTYPEESYDGDTLILCDGRIYGADVGQMVTYVVELEAEEKFEGIETMVKFGDGLEVYEPEETDELFAEAIAMPNLKGSAIINFSATHKENNQTIPVVKMNAASLRKFDFRRRKVLLQVDFIVAKPGVYNIDLAISEMSIDGVRSYFVRGEQVLSDGIEIYEYVIVN